MWRLYLLSGGLAVALVTTGIIYVRHQGAEAALEKQYKADIAARDKKLADRDVLDTKLQAALTALQNTNQQLTKELNDETSKPIYHAAACILPADGLRLYNASRAGSDGAR